MQVRSAHFTPQSQCVPGPEFNVFNRHSRTYIYYHGDNDAASTLRIDVQLFTTISFTGTHCRMHGTRCGRVGGNRGS
jgi:hypothetical protein